MIRHPSRKLMIMTLLAGCVGCETDASRLQEIMDAYRPMWVVVGLALFQAEKSGETLPDSEEALAEWVRVTPFLADAEQRKKAQEFCERGVYRTNVQDTKGKRHDYIAMYHVVVSAGSLICTFGSGDGWTPRNNTEKDARRLYGDALVDTVIARAKNSS